MNTGKDLYKVLGISKNASDAEIRKVYRKLARKYHPDVNPGNAQAAEQFKEVTAAYEVLSDPKKRKLYDEFGDASLHGGFDPERARAYQQWASSSSGRGNPYEGVPFDVDLGDLFQDLFAGRRSGFSSRSRQGPVRGDDVAATVDIDLSEALSGSEVRLRVPTHEACGACGGTGKNAKGSVRPCPACKGTGQASRTGLGRMRMRSPCQQCGGTGKLHQACTVCGGRGVVGSADEVTVRIPPGADHGSRLRVKGRGGAGLHGGGRGDLLIETRIRPHPFFRREGLDLFLSLPVTVDEAYNGASIQIPTPSGNVRLRVPPKSQSGTRLRLTGKGVTRGSTKGNLFVEIQIHVPDVSDSKFSEAVKQSESLYTKSVRKDIQL